VRRTYLTGLLLAIFIGQMQPPCSQRSRVESASPTNATPANPTQVGKADIPRLGAAVRPSVTWAPSTDPSSHPVDLPPLPASPSDFTRRIQSRPRVVLELIHYPWQQLGYEVVFLQARPGFRAMTISDRRRIEIYVRSSDPPLDTAFDVAHELGHAFDLEYNDAERRSRWCAMRGIDPDTPWFGCNRCPDYSTPAGDFAETFAFLLLGPGSYHSRMAPPPKLEEIPQLAAFCHIDLNGLWYGRQMREAKQQGPKGQEPPTSEASKAAGAPR